MCDHRLPAVALQDLERARSALMTRLLGCDWSSVLIWTWAGRVCAQLHELERKVVVELAKGNTEDACGHAGDCASHYRQAARRGVTGGDPFAQVAVLDTVRHEPSDTTITIIGTPTGDDEPEGVRAA